MKKLRFHRGQWFFKLEWLDGLKDFRTGIDLRPSRVVGCYVGPYPSAEDAFCGALSFFNPNCRQANRAAA